MADLDDFQSNQLTNKRSPRRTYLVTYSQADLTKFPTRKSFGKCMKQAFNAGTGKVKVDHWACCLETHKDGGKHFHVSLKLSGPKRWISVKESLVKNNGVVVNFSDSHENYNSAYKYVCKEDTEVQHSKRHPNLKAIGSPSTKKATQAYRKKRKSINSQEQPTNTNGSKNIKVKRLSNIDISEYMIKNNIHRDTELMAAANQRKKEGEKDLVNFILGKSPKHLSDLIENVWRIENATALLERENKPRMELIHTSLKIECATGCERQWLQCALEVLHLKRINKYVFAAAVREALVLGRGKHRNIIIVGPTNCAKTFMLKPLEIIFKVFCNPANDKYAWISADQAELILLQDFRWSSELISWQNLLLLLEGETVKLPSPKNQFATDICINTDVPIFSTSKAPIEYVGKFNSRDDKETEMMSVRWKVFSFYHQFSENEQKQVVPCARCFSELVVLGESDGV